MNPSPRMMHRKHFRCTIPAEAAPHYGAMTIETDAFDEFDMRHMVLCMLGKRAAEDAVIEEEPGPRSE
jgi:hypothetical protein